MILLDGAHIQRGNVPFLIVPMMITKRWHKGWEIEHHGSLDRVSTSADTPIKRLSSKRVL